jgi:hypothetical protein
MYKNSSSLSKNSKLLKNKTNSSLTNIKNKYDYNVNNKNKVYSNSKFNKNINNNLLLINSSQIDIDNFDESAYNSEPYVLPKKSFEHNLYKTNIEKTANSYNEIKENINKKIFNSNIPEDAESLQNRNFTLLEQLDKLNGILDAIVEKKNFTQKKNVNISLRPKQNIKKINASKSQELNIKYSTKEINKKLLQSYIKQYDLLSNKYKKLTEENYVETLKEQMKEVTLSISNLEKENRKLQTLQFKSEYMLKNKYPSQNEMNYMKKSTEYNKLENEYVKIMRKIPRKEDSSKCNEIKINQLSESKESLIKMAKEKYNIENPEERISNKKVENKEKYECELKRRNLEKKIVEGKSNIKKYTYQKKENDKYIKQLENDKITFNTLLTSKQGELDKVNQQLREINGNGNNGNRSPQNENTNNLVNSQITPIKSLDFNNIEVNDNKIENMINENEDENMYNNRDSYQTAQKNRNQTIEINLNGNNNNGNNIQNSFNNRYSSNLNNNINKNNVLGKNSYDKKMILQQLDMQKNKENNAILDKSLTLKKNKLKPNFSFTLNDKKAKDIKPNLSVAVLPKTENNQNEKQSEGDGDGDGEIKEEIQSNNDINDDKINNENYPKINSNLSQNISMEKDDKGDNVQDEVGKKRENDLNTLPISAFDDGEKKFNNINDDNNFNDVSNSNEQEHVFDN